MKNIIGGLIAIILGIFCLTLFFSKFITFLTGIIPLSLIIGGGLILYLKHGEAASDTWNKSDIAEGSSPMVPPQTSPTATKPVETEPVATPANKPTDPGPQLFGNTDSLVFHTPDCRYSTNKHCTAVFNTRKNAIQEGYKPCGVCKP